MLLLTAPLLLALLAPVTAAPAALSSPPTWDPVELRAFFDGVMEAQRESHHFAGAVVTLVRGDDVLLSRGYGYADFSKRKAVDPARTLFRVASNSKMFVWTAVMQLVEDGRLDLATDVNRYLRGVRIPDTFPAPITLGHLLAHTAGFEDRPVGLFSHDPADMRPLAELLRENMPLRVFPAGRVEAYSNYGAALAALIVEQVSGVPYGRYLRERILEPLGMTHATLAQPVTGELADDVAKGYRWNGGWLVEQPFEYVPWGPIGGMSMSGEDMGRFMRAHLADGVLDQHRILRTDTARQMRERIASVSPETSLMRHGFIDLSLNGEPAFGHDGALTNFFSLTLMLPSEGVGLFVAYNTSSANTAPYQLHAAFVSHYFPVPLPEEPPPSKAGTGLDRFTGTYFAARGSVTDLASLGRLLYAESFRVVPEGYLVSSGPGRSRRWRQVGPLSFVEVGGRCHLEFSEDAEGRIVDARRSLCGGTLLKQSRWYAPSTQLLLVGLPLLALVAAAIGFPITAVLQRKQAHTIGSRAARLLAWATSLAFIAAFLAIAGALQDPLQVLFGVPPAFRTALRLASIAALLASALLLVAVWAWRRRWWRLAGRVCLSLVALAAVAATLWLHHWNLLPLWR